MHWGVSTNDVLRLFPTLCYEIAQNNLTGEEILIGDADENDEPFDDDNVFVTSRVEENMLIK